MLDRPDAFNYIFKESEYAPTAYKVARILHCNVSDTYEFFNSGAMQIGEVMGKNWDDNLEEIKQCFISDSIPCLEYEDSMPYFEDGRDYIKMVDEFVNSGKIQEGLSIQFINKSKL